MKKILVVEDEPSILSGLRSALEFQEYDVEVASSGNEGFEKARRRDLDLILLDIMLPEMDGLEICRRIRSEKNYTPVIMLTAKGSEEDIVKGLEAGADDYVTKPFGVKELLARVQAALRRNQSSLEFKDQLSIGDTMIDLTRMETRRSGEDAQPLTAKEADLIKFFCENPNKTVTRDELLLKVWDYSTAAIETRTVDIHIAKLRKKLEPDPDQPRYIQTVRGQGYRFSPV